jgi:hypothetical protein
VAGRRPESVGCSRWLAGVTRRRLGQGQHRAFSCPNCLVGSHTGVGATIADGLNVAGNGRLLIWSKAVPQLTT